MAGKITKTSEQFLAEVNQVHNNEFELCGIEYNGAKNSMSLRHKPCGQIITKRADSFKSAACDHCRRTNPNNIAKALEKRKETNKERFGAEFVMQSEIGKANFMQTIEDMGGKEEFKKKIMNTNIAKYGHAWPTQRPEVIESVTLLSKEEIKTIIDNFDGIPSILQLLPLTPYKTRSGLERIIHKYGFWDLLKHNFTTSAGEDEMFQWIKELLPEYEIIQSDRSILGRQEIDIYIPKLNIGFEYCGIYWHSSSPNAARNKPKSPNYHKDKMQLAESVGVRLIQVFESEWIMKQELTKAKIMSILGKNSNQIYARRCYVKEVSTQESKLFLEKNHVQGYFPASIRLGLFLDDHLYALMTFRKSSNNWDLSRYCSEIGFHIVGGAGKLLQYFIRNWLPSEIITFADLRWTSPNKNMYLSLGFTEDHISPPNYYYCNPSELILYHRLNFQKSRIKIKFPEIYDENCTEKEMMDRTSFLRIYDCGNIKYRMTLNK